MLDQLTQRFGLLVSRRSDITPRHRTLRAAVEWSYMRLPQDLRSLFDRLSVFRGGWTLESAAEVAPGAEDEPPYPILEGVTELRERSLIVAEEFSVGPAGTEMRYRMLETLREFAAEQMPYADRVTLHRAHALFFVRLAEGAEAGLEGADKEPWLMGWNSYGTREPIFTTHRKGEENPKIELPRDL